MDEILPCRVLRALSGAAVSVIERVADHRSPTILAEDGEVGEHRRHSPSRARAQSVALSCSTSGMWAAAYRSPAVATSDTVRIVAARPRMARSPPGHATPRPSPNQNAPKLPIRTPTENFSVFSGTAASGLRRASAATATATAAPAAPRLAGTIR